MSLSQTLLLEFKDIYQKRYGVELDDDELLKKANSLLELYKSVYSNNINIRRNENEQRRHTNSH